MTGPSTENFPQQQGGLLAIAGGTLLAVALLGVLPLRGRTGETRGSLRPATG
jgi:hypothetical protein